MKTLKEICRYSQQLETYQLDVWNSVNPDICRTDILAAHNIKYPSDIRAPHIWNIPDFGVTSMAYLATALAEEVVRLNVIIEKIQDTTKQA